MSTTPQKLPIAILVTAGFVEEHLTDSQKKLLAADHQVRIVAADGGLVQGWHENSWGHHFMADDTLSDVLSADFSGLIIPGGSRSVSTLAANPHAKRLVKAFAEAQKPIAAVGEAPQLLVAAGVAAGRRVTGAESEREGLEAAGAQFVEEPVVVDELLVTAGDTVSMTTVLNTFQEVLASTHDPVDEAA